MTIHKWAMGVGATLLLASVAGQAATSGPPPSASQVRQLFQVMHMERTFSLMNAQIAGLMGQSLPCVPGSYWQGFLDADSMKQLDTRLIPIYQKHFTAQDVAGMLRFYRSPLGQKVIAVMPETMADAMQAGRKWSQARAQQMVGVLQKEGKLNAQGRCPANPAPASSTMKGAAALKGNPAS